MSSNSSSCTIPLSQPLTATHFRFINANVPNTGYTFKSDNRNLHLFKKLTPTTTWENVSGVYQAYLEMSLSKTLTPEWVLWPKELGKALVTYYTPLLEQMKAPRCH